MDFKEFLLLLEDNPYAGNAEQVVTLSIGILASMFTAIVVTRFFFDWIYLRRSSLQSISI